MSDAPLLEDGPSGLPVIRQRLRTNPEVILARVVGDLELF